MLEELGDWRPIEEPEKLLEELSVDLGASNSHEEIYEVAYAGGVLVDSSVAVAALTGATLCIRGLLSRYPASSAAHIGCRTSRITS